MYTNSNGTVSFRDLHDSLLGNSGGRSGINCVLCLDDAFDDTPLMMQVVVPCCGSAFHVICLQSMQGTPPVCPVCGAGIQREGTRTRRTRCCIA